MQRKGVVVYPDIVAGNPLCFNNVARWWLGIAQESTENEIAFTYTAAQNSHVVAPNNLCIWYIEDFFKEPMGENRYQTCYRVHKGASIPRIPETNSPTCKEITGQYPATRRELAQLLQTSNVFYSYDNLSALSIEARLCGCPVKYIGYSCIDKAHSEINPFSQWAEASPEEEVDIEKLRGELPLFREAYAKASLASARELDTFIHLTQTESRPYIRNVLPQALQSWLPIHLFGER
jgi:hypothetical protein